jgi:hypothetical protein
MASPHPFVSFSLVKTNLYKNASEFNIHHTGLQCTIVEAAVNEWAKRKYKYQALHK